MTCPQKPCYSNSIARSQIMKYLATPGLNGRLLFIIPEKAICCPISFDEPKWVFLRERQLVTLLHHPPPLISQAKGILNKIKWIINSSSHSRRVKLDFLNLSTIIMWFIQLNAHVPFIKNQNQLACNQNQAPNQ